MTFNAPGSRVLRYGRVINLFLASEVKLLSSHTMILTAVLCALIILNFQCFIPIHSSEELHEAFYVKCKKIESYQMQDQWKDI